MANRKDEPISSDAPGERPASSSTPDPSGGHPAPPSPERAARQAARAAEDTTSRAVQAGEASARMADRGLRQAEQAQALMVQPTEIYRELAQHSQADFDAMLQTGTRVARGLQEMSLEVSQFTQQSLRLGMRLANEMMECRSVEDMMAVQRDFMKESLDSFLTESTRLLTLSSRLANDAVAPVAEKVTRAGETLTQASEAIAEAEPEHTPPSRGRDTGQQREVRH
ncbi:MAG TPA: phasin family protein [Patescibacteria group bacterium]|nr:phasin family protein [Patescibacteria group bacterium]